jgi:protoporphyrinogen oxidase
MTFYVHLKENFLINCNISNIFLRDGLITSIEYFQENQQKTIQISPEDFVVSTLPLALTTQFFSKDLPSETIDLSKKMIVLNDLILVFFHVDVQSLIHESWIFIPDPKIIFHRLSEQESFDPSMTPAGSIVCCEIMSSEKRPLAEYPDSLLISEAILGMNAMGYQDFQVLSQKVIRLPKSYPVFRPGFEPVLDNVLQQLDSIKNFKTVGRQGAFNYIGTLDAMDIGYGFTRWLQQKKNVSAWAEERVRTNHYPVLD